MSDSCGKNCRGITRKAYCSDRTCGGSDCRVCFGPGVDHSQCDEPEPTTCPECDGMGDKPCPDCDGAGMIGDETCEKCLGYKLLTCPECDGSGEVENGLRRY